MPFRMQQMAVSAIGALLLLPTDLFMGGMFSFAFAARESLWAWLFDLTAFWCQILGILASFFKPRLAGLWMLLNIAVSIAIAAGFALRNASGTAEAHANGLQWFAAVPVFLKTAGWFWAAPLALALLLLRPAPRGEGRAQATVDSEIEG